MENLIVFIPESFFIKYFVYEIGWNNLTSEKELSEKSGPEHKLLISGKVKFRSPGSKKDNIISLVKNYNPKFAAIRVLYGGKKFNKEVVCDNLTIEKLEKLVAQSPLDIPAVIRLIKLIKEISPNIEIKLFFETAFFASLPDYEQVYALDKSLLKMDIRRYGYHGLIHKAVYDKIKNENPEVRKIISICLDPVPEIAAVIDGKPIMTSSGATPVEGIPGDTTCGELDPGILILIEEKKKYGAETLNEIITRQSGLSAIAGKQITISDVFKDEKDNKKAAKIFKYKILLQCGSAIAAMDGFDALAFSGRYVDAAHYFADWLIPELKRIAVKEFFPKIFYFNDSVEKVIANEYLN